jgi:ADP-ribose pyrophosphatase YjhB (NUDIX family)
MADRNDPDRNDLAVEPRHEIQHQHPANVRFCPLCAGAMELRPVLPDRRRHKVCSRCGYIDFQSPKLVAGCLVIDAGRVLLLRRAIPPRLGLWTFPGGYVDFGEMPQPAALRETVEEVGMNVTIERLLGVYADPQNPIAAVVVYIARPGRERPGLSDEASEVRYFAPAELPWPEIAFRTTDAALRDWIAYVESGGRINS